MKTILLPIAFSANTANTLSFAIELAKKTGAHLTIIHVFPVLHTHTPLPLSGFEETYLEEKTEIESALQAICQDISLHTYPSGEPVSCDYLLQYGEPVAKITAAARQIQADLIIMSTQYAKGLEILFGSITSKTVQAVNCPVLMIPEHVTFKDFTQVVYATDLSDGDRPVLSQLISFLKPFHAQLTVLHLYKDHGLFDEMTIPRYIMSEGRGLLGVKLELIRSESPAEEIHDFLQTVKADVLCLSTYERDLLDAIFHASFTKQLIFHTQIPLLIFHKQLT